MEEKDEIAAIFTIHCFCVPAGLCDINEGTMVPEDRCKSPTSGNHHFLFHLPICTEDGML